MTRIEWCFTEESVLSIGYWYAERGDPVNEVLLTLTDVVRSSDNPMWCLREHAVVMRRILEAAWRLLDDLDAALGDYWDDRRAVVPGSPLEATVVSAHQAVQHVLILLVDALVECRRGRLESDLRSMTGEAADLALVMADAINATMHLGRRLPDGGSS